MVFWRLSRGTEGIAGWSSGMLEMACCFDAQWQDKQNWISKGGTTVFYCVRKCKRMQEIRSTVPIIPDWMERISSQDNSRDFKDTLAYTFSITSTNPIFHPVATTKLQHTDWHVLLYYLVALNKPTNKNALQADLPAFPILPTTCSNDTSRVSGTFHRITLTYQIII